MLLTDWFKQIFAPAGTLGNFSNCSFNIGMATFAAYISVSDNLIQALGSYAVQQGMYCLWEGVSSLISELLDFSWGSFKVFPVSRSLACWGVPHS